MVTPKLALTFDYQGWMLEDGDLTVFPARFRQGLQIWGLGLTWYPGDPETAWGGMYFRLSGGPALANFAITTIPGEDPTDSHGDEERLDEWGWGIGSSVGYEFFVTDTVGIGPALNFAYQSIQTTDSESDLGQAFGEQLTDQGRWLTVTLLVTIGAVGVVVSARAPRVLSMFTSDTVSRAQTRATEAVRARRPRRVSRTSWSPAGVVGLAERSGPHRDVAP